ncbi:MAG: carbohydrate ABC transporter permease, partial [Terrimicrobiaceae bacterium]
MFSPIARRSFSTRALFAVLYLLLILGAVTMVVPLMIMLSGSTKGVVDSPSMALVPGFLSDDTTLWRRYLEEKYCFSGNLLRAAWNDSEVLLSAVKLPDPDPDPANLAVWQEFINSRSFKSNELGLAFAPAGNQLAALNTRAYRRWLSKKFHGNLADLNRELKTQYESKSQILPPPQNYTVVPPGDQPVIQAFEQFTEEQPISHRFPLSAAGYYRAVYLPSRYNHEIGRYNQAAGTQYASFADVPFPSTAPAQGGGIWLAFVRAALRPDLIALTEQGEQAFQASGLSARAAYIRDMAGPGDVSIQCIDQLFERFSSERGMTPMPIPAAAQDWDEFSSEKTFWRFHFLSQNYVAVMDEISGHGGALFNTLILVVLFVVTTLTVNPVAAYALSRYRMKQTYSILLFLLATSAFPAEVAQIPSFIQIRSFGLLNTYAAIILPGLASGMSIFLLKGFFDSLPRELYEAADIDGASEWQKFWGITMTLSKPILAVNFLAAFTAGYTAFFFAIILCPSPHMWTLMVYIYQLMSTSGPGIVYAALVITALPQLLIFLLAQNVIMRGIV